MPGVTYTPLVFDDQVDGGGNGGQLVVTIDQAPPPPTIEVSVDPRGTVDARAGVATVTGTYTCVPAEGGMIEFAYLDVPLTQRAGRVYIQGGGFLEPLTCDGTEQPKRAAAGRAASSRTPKPSSSASPRSSRTGRVSAADRTRATCHDR